jgi:catechol 2,3-dioxygenase-like lactoylglutathione lyase family enzyme
MRFLAVIILTAAVTVAAHAQGQRAGGPPADAAPVKGATTGFMHAIHATNNVETTLAFYTEVFGLGGKVTPFANPAVPILTNSPGVNLRISMLRIPGRGFGFELTEFTNTERTPRQFKLTDPGAPHMKFMVKDIDAVVAAAKQRGATIISTGGAPVALGLGMQAVFMRDPDGYIVEAISLGPPPADASPAALAAFDTPGNIVGSVIGLTVADMTASLKFWNDMLGWEFGGLLGDGYTKLTAPEAALMAVPVDTEVRIKRATIPGSNARMELTEFRGQKLVNQDMRVPDPGASGMAIRVGNIQELLPTLKAAGVRVISKDQALVEWDAKTRNVFVKDPNGLLIEIVGTVAPPAAQ